jgi:ribosomal protein L37AE/L43A
MEDTSPQVKLPGTMYRKRGRWWWKVRLPGETSSRRRALRPQGSRCATTEQSRAQEIAFGMWQEAVRAEARAAVEAELATRMKRLRIQCRDRTRKLKDGIEKAEAKAEEAMVEKERLDAELHSLSEQMVRAVPCECCDRPVPEIELQRIDSGQWLCRSCLDGLHKAAQRQVTLAQNTSDRRRRTNDRRQGMDRRQGTKDRRGTPLVFSSV